MLLIEHSCQHVVRSNRIHWNMKTKEKMLFRKIVSNWISLVVGEIILPFHKIPLIVSSYPKLDTNSLLPWLPKRQQIPIVQRKNKWKIKKVIISTKIKFFFLPLRNILDFLAQQWLEQKLHSFLLDDSKYNKQQFRFLKCLLQWDVYFSETK